MTKGWTEADLPQGRITQNGAPPRPPQTRAAPTMPPAAPVPTEKPTSPKRETVAEAATLLARSGIRWYCCRAADPGLLQVKFTGIPEERLNELIHAATQLFPELRQY